MKNTFFFLVFLFVSTVCLAQFNYTHVVIAENGLLIRSQSNDSAKVIGKYEFGTQIQVVEQTNTTQSIIDEEKMIIGNWVKVKINNYYYEAAPQHTTGFVFNGFLEKTEVFVKKLNDKIRKYKELDEYEIDIDNTIFCLKAIFFDDNTVNLAILIKKIKKDKNGMINKNIVFLENQYKSNTTRIRFQSEEDGLNWVGVFMKVKAGTVLWSNYEDNWRDFKDVPENEKVILEHDAILLHAEESCGGGFVFWKDGKFNWLQQE